MIGTISPSYRLPNTYVYDIDDLQAIVAENLNGRKQEAAKAEGIVADATAQFKQWYENLKVVPTIVALRQKIEAIIEGELDHTLSALDGLSPHTREALKRMQAVRTGPSTWI